MNKLRTRLKAISMPLKTLALALALQCGTNTHSQAQPNPSWLPAPPTIPDMTIGATQNGNFNWVNTDLYNLYPSSVGGSMGYLHATAYDTWDPAIGWYVVVVVYNSLTSSFAVHKIVDARHPDIVIADHPTAPLPGNMPNYRLAVVYEDMSVANTTIKLQDYNVNNAYTAGFNITTTGTNPDVGNTSYPNKCPHIDMAPNQTASTFVSGNLTKFVITWAEDDGGWKVMESDGTIGATPSTGTVIDDGENPDVAHVVRGGSYFAHFVYYHPGNQELKHAEYDVSTPSLMSTQVLESAVTVTGYPRIEAFNRDAGPSNVAWHAVAEVLTTGPKWDIHEYRSLGGIVSTTDYSNIPVYNVGSGTTNVLNNPLFTSNGFAPCVAAGNGPATLQRPTDVGNNSYTMGWWINKLGQYHALSTLAASTNAADAGYKRINQQSVTAGGMVKQGKSWLALANGSNDGDRLAAAWVSDFHTTPSGSGAGVTIEGKVSNNFSFKPTSITINNTRGGWLVYPNPATDYVGITGNGKASYALTDVTGRALLAGEITDAGKISISHLPQGMYLLQIASEGKTESIKVVKE